MVFYSKFRLTFSFHFRLPAVASLNCADIIVTDSIFQKTSETSVTLSVKLNLIHYAVFSLILAAFRLTSIFLRSSPARGKEMKNGQ